MKKNQLSGHFSLQKTDDILDVISSSVGSLTNPNKIANTFKSVKNISISDDAVAKYHGYFSDAFFNK